MITFEVGKIYQSRDNKHRRILVVGRTRCYITVQYIVDGNHAIDSTRRFKVSIASPDDCEMIFDSFNGYSYHAALEVTERPGVDEVSMAVADDVVKSDTAEFTAENSVCSEPAQFEVGKIYPYHKDPTRHPADWSNTAVSLLVISRTKKTIRAIPYLNEVVECGDWGYDFKITKKGQCEVAIDKENGNVYYANECIGERRALKLIDAFSMAFKDNFRNENPEHLHPQNHRLTYAESVNHVWLEKRKQLLGLRTYDDVYYAIRSEGYVINQTKLTVECKRFKPCDIKVGGR